MIKRLFDIPYHQLESFPNAKMFCTKVDGNWEGVSTKDFLAQVNLYSRALVGQGIKPNDKIGIIASNRVEWNIMDLAILQIGAIVVPIYPNIATKDYIYIFNDAEIKLCFVGTEELYTKISDIKKECPSLDKVLCFDKHKKVNHYTEIEPLSKDVNIRTIEELKANVRNEALASIIYTSGTTGNPKGVMLSHNNT